MVEDNQTAAQKQAAAKLALRKQLEKTLLQIPPPKVGIKDTSSNSKLLKFSNFSPHRQRCTLFQIQQTENSFIC